jgi:negative regulator of sigma E activity
MNCLKFETIINDLVRAPLMDADMRASGLAHAENCPRCASRLADEKALTLGLRAMSACVATKDAPARVEAALLAAFRAGTGVETDAPQTDAVVVQMPQRTRPRWSWQAGAAVAAAILLAVTLSILRLRPQQPTSSQTDAPQLAQVKEATPAGKSPSMVEVDNAQTGTDARGSEVLAENQETKRPRKLTTSYQAASLHRPARHANAVINPNNGARVVNAGSNAGEAEIATDFMPLTYDGGAMAMESGHVVRVELPRTALVSMGLPMNPERAGELVKADVLMGDDGVARAIRFVR